jgi:hypothetical protein
MPACSQSKCPIATSGVCLEGHTEGCPHLLVEPNESPDPSSLEPVQPSTPEPYRFHSGEKLTPLEASRMMNAKTVKMVLCAGAQRAGKTTFVARIGEMFRNGSFKDFSFAGSKTLCAFERVTWLATISSGGGRPDTKRTYRSEQDTFFHIKIQSAEGPGEGIDLLISDLPGEVFPAVISSKEICDEQLALARADHLVFFVDCGSIIDSAGRHSEKDMALSFLSRVKKCRHDPATLQITVVFSRWDKVLASGERRHEHEEYCDGVELSIRDRFGGVFGGLQFDRVAARPDPGIAQTHVEIQTIFGRWLQEPPSVPLEAFPRTPKPARDFCAFGIQ